MRRLLLLPILALLLCYTALKGQTYAIPAGQGPAAFTLPDSSRLLLNSGSQATYTMEAFGPFLQLQGAAYLVRHPSAGSDYITVHAVGRLNMTLRCYREVFLSNYSDDAQTKVTSHKGQVRVNYDDSVYVVNDQQVFKQLFEDGPTIRPSASLSDSALMQAEIEGFYPLGDLVNDFARYYGRKVRHMAVPRKLIRVSFRKQYHTMASIMKELFRHEPEWSYTLSDDEVILQLKK